MSAHWIIDYSLFLESFTHFLYRTIFLLALLYFISYFLFSFVGYMGSLFSFSVNSFQCLPFEYLCSLVVFPVVDSFKLHRTQGKYVNVAKFCQQPKHSLGYLNYFRLITCMSMWCLSVTVSFLIVVIKHSYRPP